VRCIAKPVFDTTPFKVMARLQTFLPEIENANKQLSEQLSIDPKQVDIENVDEDGQFIEMVCILV
jgi:hypothetical protein